MSALCLPPPHVFLTAVCCKIIWHEAHDHDAAVPLHVQPASRLLVNPLARSILFCLLSSPYTLVLLFLLLLVSVAVPPLSPPLLFSAVATVVADMFGCLAAHTVKGLTDDGH